MCRGTARDIAKLPDGFRDLARIADLEVDVIVLKNAADIGFVGRAAALSPDRGRLVAESFEECERELVHVERLIRECG